MAADNPVIEAAATDNDGQGNATAPLVLDTLVAPLAALPEEERMFGASSLVQFSELMKKVQVMLLTRSPETEQITDQDRIILTYLAAYFKGVCATPHIIHGDMMERAMVASGIVMPFAGPSETGGTARFGVPTNVTPDVLCDSVSELCRMATAALLALYVYLNFKRQERDLPSDEAVLVFTTIAVNSTANADNAAKIDKELEELDAPGGIRCAQIRWLMHFVRQLVMTQMGAVCHLLGDKRRHAECVVAAQHDHRQMARAVPDVAMGYSLWARSAMGLQQMAVAGAVLQRGLDVAKASKDDGWEASMSYQLAVAKLLGCDAPGVAAASAAAATQETASPGGEAPAGAPEAAGGGGAPDGAAAAAAAAEAEEFDATEVIELRRRGDAARESVLRWWPEAWVEQAPLGEPDRTVLSERLIPMAEEKSGVKVQEGNKVPVLKGVLYVTRAPSSVPPGALDQLGVGGGGEGAKAAGEERAAVAGAQTE